MSFRDNLLHLRSVNNMTQEQLAVLLGVSRQSVTKWEAEKSYPEMDKLIKMCQIFDCTLDDLVQGDLTSSERSITASFKPSGKPEDLFGYDEHMKTFANKISGGVMLIILGAAFMCLFDTDNETALSYVGNLPENIALTLGLMILFGCVAGALALIIPAGMEHSAFVKQHPFIEDFYTEDQKARARSVFSYELVGGITLIFIGICLAVFFDVDEFANAVSAAAMLVCIAIGVRFIIHGSLTLSRVHIANYNEAAAEVLETREINALDLPPEQKRELTTQRALNKQISALCGVIMIVATIAGLITLFVPQYQSAFFWLAWPIGGMLCGIISLLIKAFSRE